MRTTNFDVAKKISNLGGGNLESHYLDLIRIGTPPVVDRAGNLNLKRFNSFAKPRVPSCIDLDLAASKLTGKSYENCYLDRIKIDPKPLHFGGPSILPPGLR